MSEMTPEEIAEWVRSHPITRFECTTFRVATPTAKFFLHTDQLRGEVMGNAISTQGKRKGSMVGKIADSITESLDSQPATPG